MHKQGQTERERKRQRCIHISKCYFVSFENVKKNNINTDYEKYTPIQIHRLHRKHACKFGYCCFCSCWQQPAKMMINYFIIAVGMHKIERVSIYAMPDTYAVSNGK